MIKKIDGSSSFRVILFEPGKTTLKASNRLCICEQCKFAYGSCELFTEYSLEATKYNRPYLRSDLENSDSDEGN